YSPLSPAHFFLLLLPRPPLSPLFPYTTLFRSFSAAALFAGLANMALLFTATALVGGLMALIVLIVHPRRAMRGLTARGRAENPRSEEHTSELQSRENLVCRLLLEKKKKKNSSH